MFYLVMLAHDETSVEFTECNNKSAVLTFSIELWIKAFWLKTVIRISSNSSLGAFLIAPRTRAISQLIPIYPDPQENRISALLGVLAGSLATISGPISADT